MNPVIETPYGPFSGPIPQKVWSASLTSMLRRALTCQGGPKRCTTAWWRDLAFGRCEMFGLNAHTLNPDTDRDTATMFFCCFWVLGLGYCKPNYCLPCLTSPVRTQLRHKFQLPPDCCGIPWVEDAGCGHLADCCTMAWCGECAECQLTHELYVQRLLEMPADGSWPYHPGESVDPAQVADTQPLLLDQEQGEAPGAADGSARAEDNRVGDEASPPEQ